MVLKLAENEAKNKIKEPRIWKGGGTWVNSS